MTTEGIGKTAVARSFLSQGHRAFGLSNGDLIARKNRRNAWIIEIFLIHAEIQLTHDTRVALSHVEVFEHATVQFQSVRHSQRRGWSGTHLFECSGFSIPRATQMDTGRTERI